MPLPDSAAILPALVVGLVATDSTSAFLFLRCVRGDLLGLLKSLSLVVPMTSRFAFR